MLQKEVCIVCGSTHGIGKAIAEQLLNSGYEVIGCAGSVDDPRGRELEKKFAHYHHYIVDISKQENVKIFFEKIDSDLNIRFLINCAGIGFAPRSITEFCAKEGKRVLDVNLIGNAFLLKYGLPHMGEHAVFLVCGSIAADRAGTGADAMYGASKAGLRPLLRQAAKEFPNISFCYANLGYIQTRMTASDHPDEWRSHTPYGEPGTPAETAGILIEMIENRHETGYFEAEIIGGGYPKQPIEKKSNTRKAGVLLPVNALPNAYSCGAMGPEAYRFIDILKEAGIRVWMMLPTLQTNSSNSPYSAISSIAGSLNFISPELLYKKGWLSKKEKDAFLYEKEGMVDYGDCYRTRPQMMRQAYCKFLQNAGEEEKIKFDDFCQENRAWLDDYSVYLSVKFYYNGKSWKDWPDENLRTHDEDAIAKYCWEHFNDVNAMKFSQYVFYQQLEVLKKYANQREVQLIGDLPFYVGADSSDVWANRSLFSVDEDGNIVEFAGIPNKNKPDTNWGNPCYVWSQHKKDGFAWWRQRIRFFSKYYDALRIDHAVGTFHYYAISAEGQTGVWKEGPDTEGSFTQMIKNEAVRAGVDVIFEDLGAVPKGLRDRMNTLGFYGMRILQYGYSTKYFANSYHLPLNFTENTVCFTETHDNLPLAAFLQEKTEEELKYFRYMLNVSSREKIHWELIRTAYNSVAGYCIIPIQDFLELGEESCFVNHGCHEKDWLWRMKTDEWKAFHKLQKKLRAMAILSGRYPASEEEAREALAFSMEREEKDEE